MIGYIYAVECGGRIKIGFSFYPEKRLSKIASDSPFECELLGYWPGSKADEISLHERFRATRVHREWFDPSEELRSLIAKLAIPSSKTDGRRRLEPKDSDSLLIAWRKAEKLTGSEAASMFGITKSAWSRLENGKVRVPAERAQAVSAVTGIPVEDLRPDIFKKASAETAA